MTEYTPEKVAELVAEVRDVLADHEYYEYRLIARLGAALAAVSAERDAEHVRAESGWKTAREANRAAVKAMDKSDRLHKAITDALAGLELSAEPDWPGWNVLTGTERILRAALDKEGNDDE